MSWLSPAHRALFRSTPSATAPDAAAAARLAAMLRVQRPQLDPSAGQADVPRQRRPVLGPHG